jgi:peptidoglycan-associated lipoprotein
MKKNIWLRLAVLLLIPGMLLTVSCGKKKAEPSAPQPVVSDESASSSYDDGSSRGADDAAVTDADRERFTSEPIYFAFDSASIDDAGRAVVDSKAAYLKNNTQAAVVVEGHCDERGTNEYNIALGDRRANAVKNLLVDLGADGSKLTTISYGEERLADPTNHDKNRRVQCVIE